ncbi:DUF6994 family protein [Ligilactobacillus agilis]|uniref:DUF6994 family protein n=1 Tax=Ligilactobacillus agilis TaxID=1601 RepID=UPI0024C36948|nr:hypothetical protein [Ligilactobacillus agilis]
MKNYLFDLYPNFPKNFRLNSRIDPDSQSKELYDDLRSTFFSDKQNKLIGIKLVENRLQQYGNNPKFFTLFVDTDKFLLSSDYIGASVYWAVKAGFSEDEIIDFLRISRTLGGHIVFPRGENSHITYRFPANKFGKEHPITMNNSRGGEKGYYDRFDLTLFAIKRLFENKEISNKLMEKAWSNYSDWFDLFRKENNGFKTFVDFFKLNDFVDNDYKVYDLTTYDVDTNDYNILENDYAWIPDTLTDYRKYVVGVNHAIELRNNRLA